jgi:hypothetical protein
MMLLMSAMLTMLEAVMTMLVVKAGRIWGGRVHMYAVRTPTSPPALQVLQEANIQGTDLPRLRHMQQKQGGQRRGGVGRGIAC